MSEKKHKRAKPESTCGFGIVNPWGQFWSLTIYANPESAKAAFDKFWRGDKDAPSWKAYRVVPARLTISEITPTQEPTR